MRPMRWVEYPVRELWFLEERGEKGSVRAIFGLDQHGNPLASTPDQKRTLRECRDLGLHEEIVEYTAQRFESGEARCPCGASVSLFSTWANPCSRCGREMDAGGRPLAPREQWGEETGERF